MNGEMVAGALRTRRFRKVAEIFYGGTMRGTGGKIEGGYLDRIVLFLFLLRILRSFRIAGKQQGTDIGSGL